MKKLCLVLCLALVLCIFAGCADDTASSVNGTLEDDDAIFTLTYNDIRPSIHDDEIDAYCEEHNYKQITKNEDGSYTFRQDREAYDEVMTARRESLVNYLNDTLTGEAFGEFVVEYDLDEENSFREIVITVDYEKYSASEDCTDLIGNYIVYAYHRYMEDTDPEPGCTVEYVSASTGVTIQTYEFPSAG